LRERATALLRTFKATLFEDVIDSNQALTAWAPEFSHFLVVGFLEDVALSQIKLQH
jgi:hypothetical protein